MSSGVRVTCLHTAQGRNTRGALDASGRPGLRAPYLPWLGAGRHTSTPYEYRCPFPDTHPVGCGARHATELERTILATDLGQTINPPVAEGFAMYAQRFLDAGFSVEEIHHMVAVLPARLLER